MHPGCSRRVLHRNLYYLLSTMDNSVTRLLTGIDHTVRRPILLKRWDVDGCGGSADKRRVVPSDHGVIHDLVQLLARIFGGGAGEGARQWAVSVCPGIGRVGIAVVIAWSDCFIVTIGADSVRTRACPSRRPIDTWVERVDSRARALYLHTYP